MKKTSVFIITIFLIMTLLVSNMFAAVYVTGKSSVKSGSVTYMTGNTKYASYVPSAVRIWDGLTASGPDLKTLSTGPATGGVVSLYDVNDPTADYAAAWGTNHQMKFNDAYMQNYTINKTISIIAHEVGHSIGLNENKVRSANIMWYIASTRTSLGTDDLDSYNYVY